ncbi:MAG: UDP-N-acetylmuramoyl-tripeptide--D-alanyl-D-alanine ligase [Gammaproteobacteria bacterium]
MMTMPLSEAAHLLATRYEGADVTFRGVSTDTRTLAEGNLFVALQGPNFDGHEYLHTAQSQGAVAAAISESTNTSLPVLRVADTRIALGQLAKVWRERFSLPVIGVTGSNGKTTVKEMLAAILGQSARTLATRGNLNNDIGLPQTLFRLDDNDVYAVIEMGASQAGEIAYLANIAQPDIAIVTNAGPAHLQGFGSLAGVAHAKGEIFESLSRRGRGVRTAVINADDAFAGLWRKAAGRNEIVDFGLEKSAAVTANANISAAGSDLEVRTPAGDFQFHLALPGKHNVMNALAAIAATTVLDISHQQMIAGMQSLRPVASRLQFIAGIKHSQIINDTYNANPQSLNVALDVLRQQAGQHWLVLGDMGELGDDSLLLHQQMLRSAYDGGVSRIFTLGKLATSAAQQSDVQTDIFTSMDVLIETLQQQLNENTVVLVKGSRSMAMERVVDALTMCEVNS